MKSLSFVVFKVFSCEVQCMVLKHKSFSNCINEELNQGFGNKVIRLLRIIIDNEEYNNSDITFERLKHKKYGENNQLIANGIYYIWHCHGLQTSFALEEQSFNSFFDATAEEYGQENDEDDNNDNMYDEYDDEAPIGRPYNNNLEDLSSAQVDVQNLSITTPKLNDNAQKWNLSIYDFDHSPPNDFATPLTPMGASDPRENKTLQYGM